MSVTVDIGSKRLISVIVTLLLLVSATIAEADSRPSSANQLLLSDYQDGKIDREEYYFRLLQTIYEPEMLPVEYTSSKAEPVKCATPIIMEIRQQWDDLSAEFKSTAARFDIRPDTELEYVSPDGFFRLHYDTAFGGATPPVPLDDLDSSLVPDFVELMASYADSAWRQIVLNFGYERPPSDGTLGGDSLYDLYFDQFQYYGLTSGDFFVSSPCDNSYSSHITLHHTFLSFPPNQDPDGNQKGSMKVAIAHELYHAVQFYYDAYLDTWWAEQTAVWMEDEVYPIVHDNYNYFDEFWPFPEMSLLEEGEWLHPYGSFVWPKYLAENYGLDLIQDILFSSCQQTSLISIFHSELAERSTTFYDEFREFLFWNYMTGERDDGLHYVDASNYPEIEIMRQHSAIPAPEQLSNATPYNLGANYIEITNDSAYVGILTFSIDTAYTAPWDISYITVDSAGVYDYVVGDLGVNGTGNQYIERFEDYQRVVFIPYVKGTAYGGPYGYVYSVYFRPIGDANNSGFIDIDDITWVIAYIFSGGPPSDPLRAMDADCSGSTDIDDVVYLISYVFAGGPAPCGEGQQ